MDAAIVKKLLATDVCAPVVAHEKEYRVIRKPLII